MYMSHVQVCCQFCLTFLTGKLKNDMQEFELIRLVLSVFFNSSQKMYIYFCILPRAALFGPYFLELMNPGISCKQKKISPPPPGGQLSFLSSRHFFMLLIYVFNEAYLFGFET